MAQVRPVPGVRQFQLVEEAVGRLRLLVVPGPGCVPEGFAEVRADIAQIMGPGCELAIDFVDRLPLPPSGKLQVAVSKLPQDRAARILA
jgi:hypothetical protein